jgi:DNA repair protein RadC
MPKRVHDIPEADRPREKLLASGAPALSDQELLAVLLGKGTAATDVLTLATQLMRLIDKSGVAVSAADMMQLDGVGSAKAALVLASLEFARRRIQTHSARIEAPADLLPHIRHYADRKQEYFLCATLNGANELLNVRVVSIGLVDRAPVHPREVFADAITDRACAIMVAHNHPSGGVAPSANDVAITAQLKAAGQMLGVELLDHLVFNRLDYYSFLENGRM